MEDDPVRSIGMQLAKSAEKVRTDMATDERDRVMMSISNSTQQLVRLVGPDNAHASLMHAAGGTCHNPLSIPDSEDEEEQMAPNKHVAAAAPLHVKMPSDSVESELEPVAKASTVHVEDSTLAEAMPPVAKKRTKPAVRESEVWHSGVSFQSNVSSTPGWKRGKLLEQGSSGRKESRDDHEMREIDAGELHAAEKSKTWSGSAHMIEKAGTDLDILNSMMVSPGERSEDHEVHSVVVVTRRLFQRYLLEAIQEEEERCEQSQEEVEGNKRKSKRPDYKAVKKMKEKNQILYRKKQFGNVPGINVGEQFNSRAEMKVLGLHMHFLAGIDYVNRNSDLVEHQQHNDLKFPLAIAVVLSGEYEDDVDNSDDIIYTGSGGHDLLGTKQQTEHQKMIKGNLALKNSVEQGTPVRVFRGHPAKHTIFGKNYTYDGLYNVTKYWTEKGISGYNVFKYLLQRKQGQPKLTTNQVHFSRGQLPTQISAPKGLVCNDISKGLEAVPIPVTNIVDENPVGPPEFEYLKSCKFAPGIDIPQLKRGCKCNGQCSQIKKCDCARANGNGFPYVRNGRLPKPRNVIYECGPSCECGPNCINRVSQKGLCYHLEVFRTRNKGWGVRSLDYIPFGAPVIEYTGIIKCQEEVDRDVNNDYLFDIDCIQTSQGIGGRQRRHAGVIRYDKNMNKYRSDDDVEESEDLQPEFCVDARLAGNVSRFINHSCDPNLYVQCILSSHEDPRLVRIMLFAFDNIKPLTELTYDYGIKLNSVADENGQIIKKACYCGGASCGGRIH